MAWEWFGNRKALQNGHIHCGAHICVVKLLSKMAMGVNERCLDFPLSKGGDGSNNNNDDGNSSMYADC